MTARVKGRAGRYRPAAVALGLVSTASSVGFLVSCTTDSPSSGSSSFSPRATPPDTASFSGSPPSTLPSAAASALASASAAASSAAAAASSFEASVSAEVTRANQQAEAELKNVQGKGNATSDVALRGKATAQTNGLRAVLVSITNSTDQQASYAVQVDFTDSSGKVVESRFVGAPDLDPGKSAQSLVVSRLPADQNLTPSIAKAQRY